MSANSFAQPDDSCVVLILHADEYVALSPLRCGAWPGFQFCAASSPAEITTVLESLPVHVAICCDSADPALTDYLQAAAPGLTCLRLTTNPDDGDALPSLEPTPALFAALSHAAQRTMTWHAATEQAILRTFAEDTRGLHDRDRIAELLLETALTLLRGQGIPAESAVLTATKGAEFVVSVASAGFTHLLRQPLPVAQQPALSQIAEAHVMLREGDRLLMPLGWFGRVHSILLLEAPNLPAALPDSLHILANQAAAALENSLLFELAAVDTTTRAYTRTFAIQRLYEALKAAYRTGLELTVLMLDLDKFKQVNDTYGHLVGDRVLHAAGQLLRAGLRDPDVLGRYGGDEFLIILPNTPIAGGVEVARRLLQSVAAFRLDLEGTELTISISIGIGGIYQDEDSPGNIIRPDHDFFHRVMERLIVQADGLMYRAKHGTTTHYATGVPLSWDGLLAGEGLLGTQAE